MKNENTKGLREGAMAVALTAVLMLLTRFMPLFSLVGNFVCGIPLATVAARNNIKTIIITFVAAFVVAILINGSLISAATILLMSCIPGGIAGYMMGKRKPFFATLFVTCLAVCAGWIFEIVMLEMVLGTGIAEMLAEVMAQTKTMMSAVLNAMGDKISGQTAVSPQQLLDTLLASTEAILRLYFPSFVIASSMITGYIIIRISGFVIRRTKLANVDIVEFSLLKAPRSMSIAALLFYAIYIFMNSESNIFPIFANVVFILYMILGICGLSVVDFKFKTKIRSAAARFAIYILVFMFGGIFVSIISTILIFIGIMDAGRDFRQIGNYGV